MKIAAVLALIAIGCTTAPELDLEIQLPTDKTRLASVKTLELTATRDSVVIAHQTFSSTAGTVSLQNVSHGANTTFTLEGLDASGSVLAQGETCPVDFEGANDPAPLYFAPVNFFGVTSGAPMVARTDSAAGALDDGTVLVAGGGDATGAAQSTSDHFTPGRTSFGALLKMNVARTRAQATPLASIGLLVTGGLGIDGKTLASSELYLDSDLRFVTAAPTLKGARVDHRAVLLADGRTFISGGSATDRGPSLATTEFVYVKSDGTFQVTDGPTLVEARRSHAVVVAVGVPLVIGGYGADGTTPIDSIEAIDLGSGVATTVAHLTTARAEATATLLADGSILIAGGVGPGGAVLGDFEIYNSVLRENTTSSVTTTPTLTVARHDQTATLLADGRVLVAGGFDATGSATDSVEIFVPDSTTFVTERSLTTTRAGHVAVPLCDGTILMVGGGTGAELYTSAAD